MRTFLISGLVLFCTHLFCSEKPSYSLIEDQASYPLLNPDMQQRKTAKIRLNNGLTAYLISDPLSEQSGGCLCVEAGSWDDPQEFPGTAHFLEHMLFLGTEKYPDEAEYKSFILDHGGIFNAFTAPDYTAYLFSINNDQFLGALDRFAQFFISPLFNESCLERELQAVDQEHAKNIENDPRREHMVFKECGNPNHPNHKFSTGNAKTLSIIPQDTLKKWYRAHYSADRMRVVLLSSLPLETMIQATATEFGPIKVSAHEEKLNNETLSSSEQKGKIIYIKPIKEIRTLTLTWELPSSFVNPQGFDNAELLAYVLKNQGKGSLTELLKSKKIAEAVEIQSSHYGRENLLFQIEVHLTEQGTNRIEEAISLCFQTFSALKAQKIPDYFATELQNLKKIHYQFQTRDNLFATMMVHAQIVLRENIETYPEQSLIGMSYNGNTAEAILSSLTPSECLFTVVADPALLHVKTDKKEKWVGVEYAIVPLGSKILLAWERSSPLPGYSLPEKNPYIPSELHLCDLKEEADDVVLIENSPSAKVYYAKDGIYQLPEVSHFIHLKSPFFTDKVKTQVLMELYLAALKDKLSSTVHNAQNAGLEAEFEYKEFELKINIQGFNEKSGDFLIEVLKNLSLVKPSKEEFAIFKQTVKTTLSNKDKEPPLTQGIELMATTVYNDTFSALDKLAILNHLSYEEFIKFSANFTNDLSINALLYGNLKETDAIALYRSIQKSLHIRNTPLSSLENKRILSLFEHGGPYVIEQPTPRQGNAVVVLIQQNGFTFKNRAIQQVLSQVIKTQFFETLRTKQQVAYMINSWDKEEEGQLFQCFALQSNSHQTQEILSRIDLFLETLNYQFAQVCPESTFEAIRESLITKLRKPPENLKNKGALLDKLAFTYGGDFQWIEKRIQSFEELTYEDVKEGSKEFFSRNNQKRIAVLIDGVLPAENRFRYTATSKEALREKGSFVSWNQEE